MKQGPCLDRGWRGQEPFWRFCYSDLGVMTALVLGGVLVLGSPGIPRLGGAAFIGRVAAVLYLAVRAWQSATAVRPDAPSGPHPLI